MALVDLHIDPEYFWALTLREFNILHKRHQVERYRTSAHVCAFIAEMHRDTEKRGEPFTIEEFLPGREVPKSSEDSADRILAGKLAFEKEKLIAGAMGWEDLTAGVHIQIMDLG